MTTATTIPATIEVTADSATPRVTQRSVTSAEWIKFRSVRSNLVSLIAAGAVLVLFGTLFSSLAGSEEALPPNATAGSDSLSMSFGGMNLSQLVLGVLGAVFVAGEYSTGMIRTMFAAVANRMTLLRAKAIVLGASSWIVMTIASFAVFFAGQAVYAGDGATYAPRRRRRAASRPRRRASTAPASCSWASRSGSSSARQRRPSEPSSARS